MTRFAEGEPAVARRCAVQGIGFSACMVKGLGFRV